MRTECAGCGKKGLGKDETGISRKMLGEAGGVFCLDCLAERLGWTVGDVLEWIDFYRGAGCELFK